MLAVPAAAITWAVLVLYGTGLSLLAARSLRWLSSRELLDPGADAAWRRILGLAELLDDTEEPGTDDTPHA